MKNKSTSTTKNSIDYTQSKDAYEGNRESAAAQDSPLQSNKQTKENKVD